MNGADVEHRQNTEWAAWPINTHWSQHREQHWYISFCLLMSAIQDHLSGLALHASHNLNWATTCHYYSMVHIGRLLCFCVVGDYPTGHAALRSFLTSASRLEGRPNQDERSESHEPHDRPIEFNWLKTFESYLVQNKTRVSLGAFAEQTARLLAEPAVDAASLRSFSAQLEHLGGLRTDANYEALIIAHEKQHERVEGAFRELIEAAESAAARSVTLGVAFYRQHLLSAGLLEGDRSSFIVMSNRYVKERLKATLQEKFSKCREARQDLKKRCSALRIKRQRLTDASGIGLIETQIEFQHFGPKSALMHDFSRKIAAFQKSISD